MMRTWLAGVIGGSLVAGLPAAVVLVAAHQSAHDQDTVAAVAQSAALSDDDKRRDTNERARKNVGRAGPLGPPPWAHAHGHHRQGIKGHPDKAWKDTWQKLTPAQREEKMAALAEAHAEGMQKWADCVAAASGDATKRAECEKPLPPGLAKRLS
jgi:hypothetical protein